MPGATDQSSDSCGPVSAAGRWRAQGPFLAVAGGKTRRLALLALAVPLLFATCTSEAGGTDALTRVRTQGLRVGFSIEPPYAFVDSAGAPTGEAPEILRHVARELEIPKVQWFPLPFHDLIPALVAGRVDVVASGLFATPDRSRVARFSRPTTCVRPVLVMRRGQEVARVRPSGEADCDQCPIAVIRGSVEQRALEETGEFDLLVLPDLATAGVAVSEGSAGAIAISAPTARALVRRDSSLVLEEGLLPERVLEAARGCAALAFRPADAKLAAAFDLILKGFVGSSTHLEMVRPFGFTRNDLPCMPAAPAGAPAAAAGCVPGRDPN